jgi:hypothetical protein
VIDQLIGHLLTYNAITSLVGQRIRPVVRKQGDIPPCIVVTPVSALGEYATDRPVDLYESRVQIDCYGVTFNQADTLSRAVRRFVNGKRFTAGGVDFHGLFLLSQRSSYDGSDPDQRVHRASIDFRVWHSEPDA